MRKFVFPLCAQLTVPEILENPAFHAVLAQMQKSGYYGVELNVTDFENHTPEKIKALLDPYGLKMTMLASGGYANRNGLSMSSEDETLRRKTVDALCNVLIPFAKEMGCGIICGFLKGRGTSEQLAKTVKEVDERCGDQGVDVYLEVTNHNETNMVNTLKEGASYCGGMWKMLPDTYHMVMDEAAFYAAFAGNLDKFSNIHVSDNNRYFPGYGALDFYQVLAFLKASGWQGTMAAEGRIHDTLEQDLAYTADYLEAVTEKINRTL